MSDEKTLTFYLGSPMRDRAERGEVNIVNRISSVVASLGFKTAFRGNTDAEYLDSANQPGLSMFHMEHPFHERALTFRRTYFYPFWRIENTSARWDWPVAMSAFDAGEIDPDAANRFAANLRQRVLGLSQVSAPGSGVVYVPLQGRLLENRSFQSVSPMEMVRETLLRFPDKEIRVALHPKETYSEEELRAINRLVDDGPNSMLVRGDTVGHLTDCEMVVTQNSSVAMQGFLLHRPAVLFSKIDFHHIAGNVPAVGVDAAFEFAQTHVPKYDRYLFWFLRKMAINAGSDNAEDRILSTMKSRGWDI